MFLPNHASALVAQDGLPQPQRSYAFVTLGLSIMMAVLDGAIMNVALPVIAAEQQVGAADAIWIITAYQLALVISLLPFAALGDAVGFKRVYMGGLVAFACGAALCSTADSIAGLAMARTLQGLGAGAIMSINGAMIRQIMPLRHMGRGISTISMIVGCTATAGPTVAGAVLAVASWNWLFLVNIPVCIAVFAAGLVTLPGGGGSGRRFDFLSALFNAFAFGFLISGLSSIGRDGGALVAAVQFAIAFVAFAALAARQRNREAPLLPVDLLRNRIFSQSIAAAICSFIAQFLAFVSLPFYFHDVLGYSAAETGLLLTPWPLAAALTAPFAGRLADRMSTDILGVAGMAIFAAGLVAMALLPGDPEAADIVWRLAICGFGFGVFQSPNNRTMLLSAPASRSGGASGMQSTARVLGQSAGAALATILMGLPTGMNISVLMGVATFFAIAAGIACCTRSIGS